MALLNKLKKELNSLKNPEQAEILQTFFKTKPGQYGEGDIFLGIKIPIQRKICEKYNLTIAQIESLLNSKIHEYRLCALFILIDKYRKLDSKLKKKIFNFYLKNASKINSWDLVDLSAPNIIGDYLLEKDKKILYKLAKSKNLWEKRIAIVSTFIFIKNNHFKDTLKISEILLNDNHDLIHKSVGWMLREVGKKREKSLKQFLKKHYKNMPRTMLRYSIEKFPEKLRKNYLNNNI